MKQVVDTYGTEGFGAYEVDWDVFPPQFTRVHRKPELLLVPGFVDVHIHGAFGIDFMSASTSDLDRLAHKLEECGYEAFLPTTVTASHEDILKAIGNLPEDDNRMPGFHLEGPFISPSFPGAQPPEFIVAPPFEPSPWDAILGHPKLKRITLAPEVPNALGLIARLQQRGVAVSMGHTNATFDESRNGFEFGATDFTHTFNAMRPLHHREAGAVGYALANGDIRCELIYDRVHVSRDAAEVLRRSRNPGTLVAVSDSTMATGMPPGTPITMWGHDCVVGRGDVRLAANDALAGSAITLLDAFRNLHNDFGPETAIEACCLNPRKSLNLEGHPRVYLEFDARLDWVGRRILDA